MQFSKRLDHFEPEIFAALDSRRLELEREGKTIYNFSVGSPDFATPEHIRRALSSAAEDPANWKYSLHDTPELLDAVVRYYKKRYDVTLTPDMICSCYGTQEGMGPAWCSAMKEIRSCFQVRAIPFLSPALKWPVQFQNIIR